MITNILKKKKPKKQITSKYNKNHKKFKRSTTKT
jgi:hypothetical protein